ncbi:MAG: hypothetical protein AB2A00_30890 [Myxococcota bacterium]
MKNSIASMISLLALISAACGQAGPLDGLLGGPAEASCDSAPTNISKDTALEIPLGQAFSATHCPIDDATALWWKSPSGTYNVGDRFKLTVDFREGAQDVDFRLGTLNAAGDDVVFGAVEGSCSHPGGADEDCTVTLSEAGSVVYVRTESDDPGKEVMRLTLTKL